ncbi:MAG: 30S ribosomal protein S20 [Fimbriimonas ginsengisoli]|uniref:Small ribosomal subunit protein bS20 n=1 Tax=Fimbriimonas ginsengisoli TaxID=1005039 RepID=A0A931PUK1_FIMGI|nr:30S ribosomal protein S20 [Fimbriimonas ginsengisoli]
MANKRSSKKDLRRIAKRRVRNQGTMTALKTYVKKARSAIASGDGHAAVITLSSALDKAAQRGIIHKNQAARRKSRIARLANGAPAAPKEVVKKAPGAKAESKPAARVAKGPAKPKAAAKPVAAKKSPAAKPAAKKKSE